MRKLLIRADASAEIGAGHLMRCLALAQAWEADGGSVTFLSHCGSPTLRRRVRDEGARMVPMRDAHPNPADLQATLRLVSRLRPDWLVIDGYHFDPSYQKAARASGTRVMVIDDMAHLSKYHADALLNQNLGAKKLHYHCDEDTRLLLGPRYVLLRAEFLKWRDWRREVPEKARKVLVTLGGSDPDNVTLEVIHALERVPLEGLEATVVLGASNPHREALQATVKSSRLRHRDRHIRIVRNSTNMPELMAWADVAVTAGGSTCWELAFMGVPTLVLALDNGQRGTADELGAREAAVSLGTVRAATEADVCDALGRLLTDKRLRLGLGRHARGLVDGYGASRVMSALRRGEACA